jgi:hypothetical protein
VNTFLDAVEKVTTGDAGLSLREAVEDNTLKWLLESAACDNCVVYLGGGRDQGGTANLKFERYRAACLLFILSSMQVGTDEDTLEALRLLAANKVDTRGASLKERYERAGRARKRPVSDARHYVRYGHLDRMQRRVANELYDLVTHKDILERALEKNGKMAVERYLSL